MVLVCATFPLIWVGGLVTTYGAGMAVADWPTTFGYNPFLYPWQTLLFGPWDVFIEHGHRLLAAAVGAIALLLAAVVWRCDERRWVRSLALFVVAAVIVQGLLGGARVIQDERLLAQVHGTFGPAFFALCVALAVCTSRRWRASIAARDLPRGAVRLAAATALLAYLQLALGARLRHMPVGGGLAEFQAIVAFHLIAAVVVLGHAVALAARLRRAAAETGLRAPALLLLGLVVAQIGLGGWTWVANYGWPAGIATGWAGGYVVAAESMLQSTITTAHVAMGSLILALAVMVALRAARAGGRRGDLLPSLSRPVEAAA